MEQDNRSALADDLKMQYTLRGDNRTHVALLASKPDAAKYWYHWRR
jgi:hypothetical protein